MKCPQFELLDNHCPIRNIIWKIRIEITFASGLWERIRMTQEDVGLLQVCIILVEIMCSTILPVLRVLKGLLFFSLYFWVFSMCLSFPNKEREEAACAGSEQQLTAPCVFLPVSLQFTLHYINVMFQTAFYPSV